MTIITSTSVFGQSAESTAEIMQKGETAYRKKDFLNAARLYRMAFELLSDTTIQSPRYMAAYNGACSWSLAGKPDSAFVMLGNVAKEVNFGIFYAQLGIDTDFNILHTDQRWQSLCNMLKNHSDLLEEEERRQLNELKDTTKQVNRSIFSDSVYWSKKASRLSLKSLCKAITSFKEFPDPSGRNFWTLYHVKVNDTLIVPYLVHIPAFYHPAQRFPLYIFMHGGVGRTTFSNPLAEIRLETPLLKTAFQQQAFIILPFANKNFNWLYHPQAFKTILQEIVEVKSRYNIDDNKVYIGGHSDGGRGSLWFALHQRTNFAAFFALNYFPTLLNDNTALRNLNNDAPVLGVSGVQDQGFNFKQVSQFVDYGRSVGANWENVGLPGGHTLPYDRPDSVQFLFDHLIRYNRKPAPSKLQLETDDLDNAESFWLKITELDTLGNTEGWHIPLNPIITALKSRKDEVRNLNKKRSGAIIAERKGSHIFIKASGVKAIEILVPEEWSEKYHNITVHINNNCSYKIYIHPNKSILLSYFLKKRDRMFLIVDKIKMAIK